MASQSNEEEAEAALRMFAEFAECPAPLLGKAVSDILTWSLQVGSSRQLSTELRHQALQVTIRVTCGVRLSLSICWQSEARC